ncbi:MAG TPA: hypothetical protein VFY92_11510 [Hyphomicrobiaceae bacterium]|nr:hypothetical protein [Hyphomicrobiaceae bacterium]
MENTDLAALIPRKIGEILELVASVRFRFADVLPNMSYGSPGVIPCGAAYETGDELGWSEHGSTTGASPARAGWGCA